MGDAFIGPEHVLLGIARLGESLAAALLAPTRADGDTLRRNIRSFSLLRSGTFELQQPVRVLDLEGSADEWEEQMNALAMRGYDFVQVIGGRAIFRRR